MPRGTYYPEELREEARRLRRDGWSLNEIAAKLGPPKNTLTLWVRGIELTPDQRARLKQIEFSALEQYRPLAADAHKMARLARIGEAHQKAQAFLDTLNDLHKTNHIAAAMLYLGEGEKGESAFAFANSNPHIIRYWLYLLRTSFPIDESKFRIQIMSRADQNVDDLLPFWTDITCIEHSIKGSTDARTSGNPTKRSEYKGVCKVLYYDISIRRYLDALAHGLMKRALASDTDIIEEPQCP